MQGSLRNGFQNLFIEFVRGLRIPPWHSTVTGRPSNPQHKAPVTPKRIEMLGPYGILRRKRETMHLSASVFRTWADSVLLFQWTRQGAHQSQRVSYLGCVRFLDQGHPCGGTQYFRDKDLQPSMRGILPLRQIGVRPTYRRYCLHFTRTGSNQPRVH
jgi:hypothetical protein